MGTFLKYLFYLILIIVIYLVGKGIYDGTIDKKTTVGEVVNQVDSGAKQIVRDTGDALGDAVDNVKDNAADRAAVSNAAATNAAANSAAMNNAATQPGGGFVANPANRPTAVGTATGSY